MSTIRFGEVVFDASSSLDGTDFPTLAPSASRLSNRRIVNPELPSVYNSHPFGASMSDQLTSQEVIQLTKDHNYGTWRKQKFWNPNHLVSADGCYFTDGNGKRSLDFSSQLMCSNLGHNSKAAIESIKKQAETLAYAAPFMPLRRVLNFQRFC